MSTASKQITADEFFDLPEDGTRRELIEGQIQIMSPAFTKHGLIGARLLRYVGVFAEQHGLGETINPQSGYIVGRNPDSVYDPDGAYVRADRLNRVVANEKFKEELPDLVVEVISPRQTRKGQIEKGWRWIKAGCEIAWIVDPEMHQVIGLEGDSMTIVSEGQELTALRLLPGFSLKLEILFREIGKGL